MTTPALALDRLLETCVKRDAELIWITTGEVPRIQLRDDLRMLELPIVTQDAINALAAKLLEHGSEPTGTGCEIRFSVTFGDGYAFFDVVMVGTTDIEQVWIVRKHKTDTPQPPGPTP